MMGYIWLRRPKSSWEAPLKMFQKSLTAIVPRCLRKIHFPTSPVAVDTLVSFTGFGRRYCCFGGYISRVVLPPCRSCDYYGHRLLCRSSALRFRILFYFCCAVFCFASLCSLPPFLLYGQSRSRHPIYINYCIKFGAKLQKVFFSLPQLRPVRWRWRWRWRRRNRERHTIVYKSLWSTEITWAQTRRRKPSCSLFPWLCPVSPQLPAWQPGSERSARPWQLFRRWVRCFDL